MDDTDPVWRIIRALHRAARLQQSAAAATELGQQALGVLNLAAVSSATPSTIAQELSLPPQTVSRAIAELQAASLVERRADPHDRRSYVLELTPSGRQAIGAFRQNLFAQFAAHLTDWTEHEIAEFASHLEALVSALEHGAPARPARARRASSWRSNPQ
ncbi:MarR family winged helix-turn-helix transcriptional regulator [Actinoplanes sp. NPDC051343]|uniref:MarR family winged helix-turn-helix transcriptional regulator n=1 Tax=Actinoplanes sp. NPDC051343 TaxID=3363906 RepID=UPI0037B3634A